MRRAHRLGVLFCLLLLPRLAAAQGTGAAGIAGTVKDASGAVLPGVTVEAASPALIEKSGPQSPTKRASTRSSSCGRAPTP